MGPAVLDDLRPLRSPDVVEAFVAGTLPADEWTHEAHLRVCVALLAGSPDPGPALDRIRALIRAHNRRVGPRPGQVGFHETLTRYFVEAVAATNGAPVDVVLTTPSCQVGAPRHHWSPPLLDSLRARTGWVDPDLAPLPWRADPSC
jgi:hypothetical protein